MVETLTTQLDDLYDRIDTSVQTAPDAGASPQDGSASSIFNAPSGTGDADGEERVALESMAQQLEALYREKEVLLERGLHSARAAVSRMEAQQAEIETLQRENHVHAQRLERLAAELGTAAPSTLVDLVRTLEDAADVAADEVLPSTEGEASPDPDTDPEPLLPPETLDRLDDMSASERDALDIGVVCLRADGTVESLNRAAYQLPALSSPDRAENVVGANFFTDLVPSTANALFYGRFRAGQRQDAMDRRFSYTFARPGADARTFAIHFYRAPGRDANWVLFRPL